MYGQGKGNQSQGTTTTTTEWNVSSFRYSSVSHECDHFFLRTDNKAFKRAVTQTQNETCIILVLLAVSRSKRKSIAMKTKSETKLKPQAPDSSRFMSLGNRERTLSLRFCAGVWFFFLLLAIWLTLPGGTNTTINLGLRNSAERSCVLNGAKDSLLRRGSV